MGQGNLRQRRQQLAEVTAHRRLGPIGITGLDRIDDRAVLGDQDTERRRRRERQEADPVHLRPQRVEKVPGRFVADAAGDRPVEGLVLAQELKRIACPLRLLLPADDVAQRGHGPRHGIRRRLAGEGDLDGLADEPSILHLAARDHLDEGAPLRPDLHQTGLGQPNLSQLKS